MSTISFDLPDYPHESLRRLADGQNVSINHLITLAVAEKMSALMTEDYLNERAQRGDRARFEAALAKVPDVEPDEADWL